MTPFQRKMREVNDPILNRASVWPVECSIPAFLLKPTPETECWECSSTVNLASMGVHVYCGGCRASMRQQASEDAYRDREDT